MLIAILLFTNETESYSIPLKRYARMVRFQVLVATNVRMTVFCDVTPCSVVEIYPTLQRCFLSPSSGCLWTLVSFYETACCNIPEDSHLIFASACSLLLSIENYDRTVCRLICVDVTIFSCKYQSFYFLINT
jgi:hypothetical protein